KIAALDASTGKVKGWNSGADGSVYALAVSRDGETLYVGGYFTSIVGKKRRNIVALDAFTGKVIEGWNPGANGFVDALAVSSDGKTLYVGGYFTFIGGKKRNNIAALDASTGEVNEGWNPGANDAVRALAVSRDGETLYVGGDFTSIGGKKRNGIAALDASTGKVIEGWNPDANGISVDALAVSSDGKTLYVGGNFSKIGGKERDNIAALDASTGEVIDDWNPGADDFVDALAVSSDGKTLYVGGYFTTIGGDRFPYYAQFSVFKGDDTIQVGK
ncbi:MAG: PQQ-binding-like beta-propeller repeat protein, partial [Candidatus Pacebacteria bacterium]|nr:PQQ-binding-like beta-propeller repeat protein [Candidatus Paceibacterota bacterium]